MTRITALLALICAAIAPAGADFSATRAALVADFAAAASDDARAQTAQALGLFYWRAGLLAEADAALALTQATAEHPLRDVIAVARGLAEPSALDVSKPLSAFVAASRLIEIDPVTRLSPAVLRTARAGMAEAPDVLVARFSPALTHGAALVGQRTLAADFVTMSEQKSARGAAAFARGRFAEALGDLTAARRHYVIAGDQRGPWAAEARLRAIAIDWAEGDITPADAASAITYLLADWPDDALAARALPALARAHAFSGAPGKAADALAVTVQRYAGTVYAAHAAVAANRLDDLFTAVFAENRYPEFSLAARIDMVARTRAAAASPYGALEADTIHLDALLATDLPEEVLTLTGNLTAAHPLFAHRLHARRMLLSRAPAPAQITIPAPPVRAAIPEPWSSARARAALDQRKAAMTRLDAALTSTSGAAP